MSFLDRFKRREKRAAIHSDDPYLGEWFGLRGGIGGYVDPGRASGIAVAHACIAIVSQNLAAMPLNLYRRADNGGRERASEHPLYAVLHDMANPTMTADPVAFEWAFTSTLDLQAGQVVVKVAVPGELEAVVNVPEARLAEFRTAEAYTVQLWAGGRQYPAQLRELSPDADAATRTYTARLTLRQPDAEVRLGMSASVAAQGRVPETAVPQLPLSAILDEGGKHYVWVLEGKTPRVKKREVGLGQVDARQAEVRSGVKPGEEIVTAGVHLLRDGMAVRRLASAAPGKPALATGQENGKAGNQ